MASTVKNIYKKYSIETKIKSRLSIGYENNICNDDYFFPGLLLHLIDSLRL